MRENDFMVHYAAMHEYLTERKVLETIASEEGSSFVFENTEALQARIRSAIMMISQRGSEAYDAWCRLFLGGLRADERDAKQYLEHREAWTKGHQRVQGRLGKMTQERTIEEAVSRAVHAVLEQEKLRATLPVFQTTFHSSIASDIDLSTSSTGLEVQSARSAPDAIA